MKCGTFDIVRFALAFALLFTAFANVVAYYGFGIPSSNYNDKIYAAIGLILGTILFHLLKD